MLFLKLLETFELNKSDVFDWTFDWHVNHSCDFREDWEGLRQLKFSLGCLNFFAVFVWRPFDSSSYYGRRWCLENGLLLVN